MIERLKITGLMILLFNCLALSGCNKFIPAIASKPQEVAATDLYVGTQPSAAPTPAPTPDTPIRRFDFRNFTYYEPKYGYLSREKGIGYIRLGVVSKHKLIDGREPLIEDKEGLWENNPAGMVSVTYADVTGDGKEEALIELGIGVRGTAIPGEFHVFTWQKDKPKLLFSFATGDRADGGAREMYANKGDLIIELNAGDENAPMCDGCQSTRFSRLRYKWNGRKFIKVLQEILPIK